MFRRLLFVLIFCSVTSVYSQSIFIGAGYEAFFPTSSVLSDFADRYNSQRAAILTKKIEAPTMFSGFSFTGGIALGPILMEMSFANHKGSMNAESKPSLTQGGATGREMNFENSVFNITFGVLMADEETESYILFPTIEGNFMSVNYKTKLTGVSSQETKYEAGSATQLGLGGALMKGIGNLFVVYVKGAYYFEPLSSSWAGLYRGTSTSYNSLNEEEQGSMSGFQVKAGIMLYWNCVF